MKRFSLNLGEGDVKFVQIDEDTKRKILDILGFEISDGIVVDKESNEPVIDIMGEKITFEKCGILPDVTDKGNEFMLLSCDPASISVYLELLDEDTPIYRKLKKENLSGDDER